MIFHSLVVSEGPSGARWSPTSRPGPRCSGVTLLGAHLLVATAGGRSILAAWLATERRSPWRERRAVRAWGGAGYRRDRPRAANQACPVTPTTGDPAPSRLQLGPPLGARPGALGPARSRLQRARVRGRAAPRPADRGAAFRCSRPRVSRTVVATPRCRNAPRGRRRLAIELRRAPGRVGGVVGDPVDLERTSRLQQLGERERQLVTRSFTPSSFRYSTNTERRRCTCPRRRTASTSDSGSGRCPGITWTQGLVGGVGWTAPAVRGRAMAGRVARCPAASRPSRPRCSTWQRPASGSRSQATSTAPRFISGSPMPMNTALVSAADRAVHPGGSATPGRGLDGVQVAPERIGRSREVQVSGQPDWLDRHSDLRPSR